VHHLAEVWDGANSGPELAGGREERCATAVTTKTTTRATTARTRRAEGERGKRGGGWRMEDALCGAGEEERQLRETGGRRRGTLAGWEAEWSATATATCRRQAQVQRSGQSRDQAKWYKAIVPDLSPQYCPAHSCHRCWAHSRQQLGWVAYPPHQPGYPQGDSLHPSPTPHASANDTPSSHRTPRWTTSSSAEG
jgi:hypothetical protein